MKEKKSVVVVGVGALGSHFVQLLRNEDAHLVIIDYDRVEQKNVASQFHAKGSVGKSKVLALQQLMNFAFGTKIDINSNKLVEQNVKQLLSNAHLVVDCLDNGESRRVVQKFVRELSIPCLHGALAADGSFGRVCWDESFVIDDVSKVGAPTCENGAHLPFIAIVAAYLARATQNFLGRQCKVGYQITPVGVIPN